MRQLNSISWCVTLPIVAWLSVVSAAEADDEHVGATIGRIVSSGATIEIDGRSLKAANLVEFYRSRDNAPAWSIHMDLTKAAGLLVEAIRSAEDDGLDPARYNIAAVEERAGDRTPTARAEIDILLSDAFMRLVTELRSGRVEPTMIDPELHIYPRASNAPELLAAAAPANEIARAIERARPRQPAYGLLRDALARYRTYVAQGGWPTLPEGPALRLGVSDVRVQVLCRRLAMTGDIHADCAPYETVDEVLDKGIKRFQWRHGLDADGVVGPMTRRILNLPPRHWVDLIALNLERWRWLPDDLGRRYVFVNMAGFELRVVEDGRTVMPMRVIIGRPYAHTPAFSSQLTHIVLNPYWHVPPRLARVVLLPKIVADPNYLTGGGFKVYPLGGERNSVDPSTIDWSALDPKKPIPYLLRQDPGPMNALGRIKFELPNDLFIYLHDTPDRGLFSKTVRAFSSGCIRVERPEDLALYLLGGDPNWTGEKLKAAIGSMVTRKVALPEPVPVHLMYMTAWVDEDGVVHFRDDVYGRDARLAKALAGPK